MQTTQKDTESRDESSEHRNATSIHMPETRTLIIAAAVAGGAIAAGLVIYYYLRKRTDERQGR